MDGFPKPIGECTVELVGQQAHQTHLSWFSASQIDSVYIHVPYCFHKCHYCDFYSLEKQKDTGDEQSDRFTQALAWHIEYFAGKTVSRPKTIFIGGGTPTMLSAEQLVQVGRSLDRFKPTDGWAEFTIEANPETVTPQIADAVVAMGANRVSLGAQSFNAVHLKTLERWHEPSSVSRAVKLLRAVDIRRINLDLIFAIPGQSVGDLHGDLDQLLELQPDHVCCYNLTFEPGTAMTKRMDLGRIAPVDEALQRDMYEVVIDRLGDAGFEHYEISNWARRPSDADATSDRPADQRCLHNLVYWQGGNWLGFGPAAASHVDGRRWRILPNVGKYIAHVPDPPIVDVEQLPRDQRIGEQLMMGLRLLEGVPRQWFDQHVDEAGPRRAHIDHMIELGLLELDDAGLRLTRQGLFVADSVIAELL